MEKVKVKTSTYKIGEYMIDIVETDDEYEAWIYRSDYGVKHSMIGCDKTQTTRKEFMAVVEATYYEYAMRYDEVVY